MIEIIGGTFGAGETKTFLINGQYLEVLDAAYPLDIYLMDKAGAQLSVMKNSEASFFSRPAEGFQTVQIYSAQAQFIRVFVGSGDAGTRRIASTVRVIDGEAERTKAGGMFSASVGSPAQAAKFSVSQLWNPAASGKNVILTQLGLFSTVAGSVQVMWSTAALATDLTAAAANKNNAFGMGAAQTRMDALAAPPSARKLFATQIPTGGGYQNWAIRGSIVIPPGNGIVCFQSGVNQDITANCEWYEETI